MLAQVNTLPDTQVKSAISNRDINTATQEAILYVSGHVVVAFGHMAKERVAVGCQAAKKPFQVTADFRVGVFLNQQRSGGMLEMEGGQSRRDG